MMFPWMTVESEPAPSDRGRDLDAVVAVAGDDVAGARDAAADRVRRRVIQDHAAAVVAEAVAAGDVGADVVAGDRVPRGAVVEQDALVVVAGDDVAQRGLGAADRVAGSLRPRRRPGCRSPGHSRPASCPGSCR